MLAGRLRGGGKEKSEQIRRLCSLFLDGVSRRLPDETGGAAASLAGLDISLAGLVLVHHILLVHLLAKLTDSALDGFRLAELDFWHCYSPPWGHLKVLRWLRTDFPPGRAVDDL